MPIERPITGISALYNARQASEKEKKYIPCSAGSFPGIYVIGNKIKSVFPKFASRALQLNWSHAQFVTEDLNIWRENTTWLLIGRKTVKKWFFSLFLKTMKKSKIR
jgi:hypothetical protein